MSETNISTKDIHAKLLKSNNIQQYTVFEEGYQVSKGEYELPYLHTVKCEESYYIVQSKFRVIEGVRFKDNNFEYFNGGFYRRVTANTFDVVNKAINERSKTKHLDNFTFLVAYCLGKGVDLYEEGVF